MKFGQSFLQFLRPKVHSSEAAAANNSNGRDLHLLAIEGKGVCGLTALIILKEILRQLQYFQNLPQPPRPCDVFDLAAGTGTGGIIVILLFRLGMTVDEAIVAYARLCQSIFSKKTVLRSQKKENVFQLNSAIAKVICSSLNVDESRAYNIRLLDDKKPKWKCFVTALPAKNLSSPTLFCSYIPPRQASYNCSIVEAVRATMAEEPYFPSIDIGDASIKETFVYGGLRLNSPIKAILEEAVTIFPHQSISCVLSIGSGAQGISGFETTTITELAKVLQKAMNDGDRIADEVAKELSDREVFYCRLNVDYGLEGIGFGDWERLGDVRTHTVKYLERYEVTEKVSRLMQVLNRRTAIASALEKTLIDLGKYLDGLITISRGESWTALISRFIPIVEASKVATDTFNMYCALLRDTLESCVQADGFVRLPDELKGNIQQLLEELQQTFQNLSGHRNTQEDPITRLNMDIQRILQRFWLQNHIAGNIMVHHILKHVRGDDSMKNFTRLEQHIKNQNLQNLNVAPFAAFDSSESPEKGSCFEGTRVQLLNEIATWVATDGLAPIFVLDGVAGIGKSAVAKTVAERAAGINVLGASFFFSRINDRKTARTFFPTVAYQLALYDKGFADKIDAALLHNPDIMTQAPLKQFSTLIIDPLQETFARAGNPILIVVDALDECEHDGDALLKIFADSIKTMPRLKLFVTTRPEYHIRIVIDRYHHLKRFHLHDIEKSVVQSDIRLYLNFQLSENQVQSKLPHLKSIWKLAEVDMEVLIGICGTLFIIASTAVRFILDDKQSDPGKQLSRLVRGVSRQDFSGSKYTTAMDPCYARILLSAVPEDGDEDDDWFEHYRIVVGTIVALQYPLPCVALSVLLDTDSDGVMRVLCHLYSLVAPTGQDLKFRIHHKSFPDFVTSPSRCEPKFCIDLTTRHLAIGKRCLKIINSQLKPNMCNLGSTDRFQDNDNILHLTQGFFTQELTYALTHWATHLASAAVLDREAGQLLELFSAKHLLAWLEVLSIIKQVETAYSSLDRLCKLLDASEVTSSITREILHDCCRFIALNIELISVAAGHVFSAIVFAPQDTKLYQEYRRLKGVNLEVVCGSGKQWNPTISIMKGHGGKVNVVAFSGDGTKFASASDDRTVRLWDRQRGVENFVLRGHLDWVKSVAFSLDGTELASASDDRTVRVWDTQTGAEMLVLRGHSGGVKSVVFSPDGTKLSSASDDGTVRVWDRQTEISVIRGHSNGASSVAFSPDSTKLASAPRDGTVRLWDWQTGAELLVLRGHLSSVNSVMFSPKGAKLASGSNDGTVRIWDWQAGVEISVLRGHSDWVKSVAFSLDSTKLASASDDGTVRLWDVHTSAHMSVLRGHSGGVTSVVFSPDGTKLASASDDGTVRLWDGQIISEIPVLRGHSNRVNSLGFSSDGMKLLSESNDAVQLWDGQTGAKFSVLRGHSVVFSLDGTKLVSTSYDRTVRLWDGQTGAEISVLRGHQFWPTSAVFSPDGMTLALACRDGTIRLWDWQRGIQVSVLRGHSNLITSVAFSPDGTKVVSASDDQTILWNRQTSAQISVLRGHSNRLESAMFSPDGTRLASASYDKTVLLSDSQTGAKIAGFVGFKILGFTLDVPRLVLMNVEGGYQFNCITGDKLAIPLGMSIDSIVKGIQVPNSNSWVILVNRKRPSLSGLFVVRVNNDDLRFLSLCWFPPDLPVINFAVSSLSRVAVGCEDGRVLLLDIDFSSLVF